MYPLIILCGGLGTRVSKEYEGLPKSLIPINKKPFIRILIDKYLQLGITDFIFCTGHLEDKLINYINRECTDISYKFNSDGNKQLGTGGAIKNMIQTTKIMTPFFICYGDSYIDIDLKEMIDNYKHNMGPMMSIFENNNNYDQSNCCLVDGNLVYSKKSYQENFNCIDYGIGLYEASHFNEFHGAFDLSQVQEDFSKKNELQYIFAKKRFYEIGSIQGINELANFLK